MCILLPVSPQVTTPPEQMVGGTTTVTFNLFRPGIEASGDYKCVASSDSDSVAMTVTVDVRCMLM